MSDDTEGTTPEGLPPDRPRLTPLGHGSGTEGGEDRTDPRGGAEQGQGDRAVGRGASRPYPKWVMPGPAPAGSQDSP